MTFMVGLFSSMSLPSL